MVTASQGKSEVTVRVTTGVSARMRMSVRARVTARKSGRQQ